MLYIHHLLILNVVCTVSIKHDSTMYILTKCHLFKLSVVVCITYVVVYTDLSGKELHRQEGVGSMATSGSLGGVMVRTLAWNVRDVGSIPDLGKIFPIFITQMTLI